MCHCVRMSSNGAAPGPGRGRKKKESRRAKGSVDQLASGKHRARITPPSGEKDRYSLGTFPSREAAEAAINRHLGSVALGLYVTPDRASTPLAVVWQEMVGGMGGAKSTLDDRAHFAANVMVESHRYARRPSCNLGHREVGTISEGLVAQWVRDLQREGVAPSTIKKWYGFVARTTAYAAREQYINRDPLFGRRRDMLAGVRDDVAGHYLFTLEEVVTMTYAALPHDALMHEVLQWSGMRQQEVRGLRPMVVDRVRRRLMVEKSVVRGHDNRPILGQVKTAGSVRPVYLPAPVFDAVVALADTKRPDEPLFPGDDGGWMDGHHFTQTYERAANKAGMTGHPGDPIRGRRARPTPHDHRSTMASWLFAIGASVPQVMAHLGHRTSDVTIDIYTEVDDWLSLDPAFRECRSQAMSIPEALDHLYAAAWARADQVAALYDGESLMPVSKGGRPKRKPGQNWVTGNRTRVKAKARK